MALDFFCLNYLVAMPTAVENSTAVGIATKEFFQKNSKAMDMRFYWINDRI